MFKGIDSVSWDHYWKPTRVGGEALYARADKARGLRQVVVS